MQAEEPAAAQPPLRLYNTMGRHVEIFEPLHPPEVLMYTCGPTVYHFTHIGNLRSFVTPDILRRVLEYNGYRVRQVKNITDVGHLRDAGDDRMEEAARSEGSSPMQVADFYTSQYIEDEARLNILPPEARPRATEYIPQMIELTQELIDKGYAYAAAGNVYFDVGKFPTYGALSGNRSEDLMAGQRVDVEPEKRTPADFALWRAGDPDRRMNWDSPWGPGFPGWHIECSAMAAELLAEQIDIHTGGVDNLFPHHEDERAQSEAANGKLFVKYWVHTAHLLFGAEKMSKSLGNIATVTELIERSINPLAFRYFLLQGHYRKQISLTDDSMEGAQIGLERLYDQVAELSQATPSQIEGTEEFRARFQEAINDDLGTPRALAVMQETLESSLSPASKLHLLADMDRVFGLDILAVAEMRSTLNQADMALVTERQGARKVKDWAHSDALRLRLEESGIEIRDTPDGQRWLRRR